MRLSSGQRFVLSLVSTLAVILFLGYMAYSGLGHDESEHYRSMTTQSPP